MVFRKQREKEFTRKVDISFLYQLGTIAAQMAKRAEEEQNKRLFDWASQIRLIVARMNGEETVFDLAAFEMPEDNAAKIPDLRTIGHAPKK